MEMTPERWRYTERYIHDIFGGEDAHLERSRRDGEAEGLPDIAVSAEVGRLLSILTSMTEGRLALEIGTLGGYSSLWILRGLALGGRLVTIEQDDRHADFATREFEKSGVAGRIELRRGAALAILPQIAREVGPGSLDVVFMDADKTEYLSYWRITRPLLKVGGLLIADNALGSGFWWIDDENNRSRAGVDHLNRALASDADFESVAIPFRQGLLIARRMRMGDEQKGG